MKAERNVREIAAQFQRFSDFFSYFSHAFPICDTAIVRAKRKNARQNHWLAENVNGKFPIPRCVFFMFLGKKLEMGGNFRRTQEFAVKTSGNSTEAMGKCQGNSGLKTGKLRWKRRKNRENGHGKTWEFGNSETCREKLQVCLRKRKTISLRFEKPAITGLG